MSFLVSGVEILFGLVPFKTSPLFALVFVVPSLFSFVVGMCVGDVFSLSLFLRCWGTPNPFWGLGFPLCSLRPGRELRLQSAGLAPHLHQGHRPAPVFFFCSPLASFGSWWLLVSFCFGGVGFFCIACKTSNAQFFGGRETIISPLLVIIMGIMFGVRASHGVPMGAPPTPFLQNAVKHSPGRGWGKFGQGNRTVTQCRA